MTKQLIVATVKHAAKDFIEFTDVKVGKKYYDRGYCSSKRFTGVKVHDTVKFLANTYSTESTTVQLSNARDIVHINKQLNVYKFTYNGFSGTEDKDIVMDYTAAFVKWTEDPGVAQCYCSDNRYRLIPTFALKDFNVADYLIREEPSVLFGTPLHN